MTARRDRTTSYKFIEGDSCDFWTDSPTRKVSLLLSGLVYPFHKVKKGNTITKEYASSKLMWYKRRYGNGKDIKKKFKAMLSTADNKRSAIGINKNVDDRIKSIWSNKSVKLVWWKKKKLVLQLKGHPEFSCHLHERRHDATLKITQTTICKHLRRFNCKCSISRQSGKGLH